MVTPLRKCRKRVLLRLTALHSRKTSSPEEVLA